MEVEQASAQNSIQRKRGRPPRETGGILVAAVAVFAREGYAAATVEMIAAQACASTATLYKRFTNKHGLFVAVLKHTTSRSLAIHIDNRGERDNVFSVLLNRLEAHAIVSTDPEVRGVMRAWIGEVRSHGELRELFAVNAGRELVTGLINQLKKLEEQKLVAFEGTDNSQYILAAQIMLGIVERFTLVRGLVLGDRIEAIFSPHGVSYKAVHAMIGIWGTPAGLEAFKAIPEASLECTSPNLAAPALTAPVLIAQA